MWNDEEDNNPYGDSEPADSRFERSATPPSESSSPSRNAAAFTTRHRDLSDDEIDTRPVESQRPQTKKGGYDSRVEQFLYEHPDLVITITAAGKNQEGGGSYIAYTIRTGDFEVRRRYSDFYSLRETLVSLHPTLIIPPIPEKHSMADYAAKPTKAKEDEAIIDHRKRMLASFLNRCRRLKDVREDGIFWKFLDPNASWNEVLHSHPVSSLPKNNLKAPPLDPANPTPGHNYLPVPSSTAKLKSAKDLSASMSGIPGSPQPSSSSQSAIGPQVYGKFPPSPEDLSESELDPYFVNFESSSRELEILLQGSLEKVNRRTLSHFGALAEDLMELGARLNGFSLSEQSSTLAAAIEKMGQAVDNTYIATGDLSSSLSAGFSEPMRESAQFAGIVRNVLRYRILKRVQGEMTRDELQKKKALLAQLERSEMEAQRIEQHLQNSGFGPASPPKNSNFGRNSQESSRPEEDTASIDSDFPRNQGEGAPSATQGAPQRSEPSSPTNSSKKSGGGNFVTNRIFGRINHAIHGIVDADPERSRRDQIGKTKEQLTQLEQALEASEKDVRDASAGVLRSLREFQTEKEQDLRRYMIAYARCHIDWAKSNLASWEEAKAEVNNIDSCLTWATLTITASHKKRKLTQYSRSPRSNWDSQSTAIFAADDEPSAAISPRSSTHTPSPAPQLGSPTTARFIPQHLQDEVFESSAVANSARRRSNSSSSEHRRPSSPGTLLYSQPERVMPGSESGDFGPSEYGVHRSELHSQPSVSFVESDMRNIGLGARPSSPAKRSRADRDADDSPQDHTHSMDVDTPDKTPRSPRKLPGGQHVSPMPSRFKPINEGFAYAAPASNLTSPHEANLSSNGGSNNLSGSEGSAESHTEVDNSYVSSTSTPATSSAETEIGQIEVSPQPLEKIPSYDEQVAIVKDLVTKQEQKDGAKGFAISSAWLARVQSRTTQGQHETFPKAAREGEVGPVDNSTIARNDNFYSNLKDAAGQMFIPLKPGIQMTQDLEILPPEAWNMVVKWYGVAEDSHVIIRYMHNTSPPDAVMPNFQYELFPPIFTIQKLRNEEQSSSIEGPREKAVEAPNLVASRSEQYQNFLRRAKVVSGIAMSVKVQVWKVLETTEARDRLSAMPTPVASRSASPTPQSYLPRVIPRLLIDLNSFTAMPEGDKRELVDIKDETANEKYNGHIDLATIGCAESQTLILEEQIRTSQKEEFVSESLKKTAVQDSVNSNATNSESGSQLDAAKPKANTATSRRSPTPSGMLTRGRANKKGKTKGCTGLVNLGNTCYMNSALQCIRSVEELTLYFLEQKWKAELNTDNPLGYNGSIAKAYAGLLSSIYEPTQLGSFSPRNFKTVLGRCQPLFSGYGQQDSQEFLSFLVDGLHEDLNRVIKKPYMENPESDDNTVHDADAIRALGEKFRSNFRARNDSVAMDLFNGFYKNTMICPVCDKVSITFDPYSLLTLQLPIESTFQHLITFAPLRGAPVSITVDIDKNSNVRMLKEYVGKRVQCKAENMVMAETYNSKFYKLFEDAEVLSEASISSGDVLWMHELDDTPTNWPPQDKKKPKPAHSLFSLGSNSNAEDLPDMESHYADRMAIPVIHRTKNRGKISPNSWPSFVLITRQEAKDYDSILRKVLRKVDTMTTKDLTAENNPFSSLQDEMSHTETDTISMTDEDSSSSEKVQARSVEGDDDLVDVSMAEPSADAELKTTLLDPASKRLAPRAQSSKFLDPTFYIQNELRRFFSMCYFSGNDIIPTGWSNLSDDSKCSLVESRVPRPSSRTTSTSSRFGKPLDFQNSESSEDELSREDYQGSPERTPTSQKSESEDEAAPTIPRSRFKTGLKKISTYSRKNLRSSNQSSQDEYLIRLGEGIVLDWDNECWESLFDGDSESDLRGRRTDKNIPVIADPELEEKKARRAARKKSGVSLKECFDETAKSEILSEENAWYCSRCKELRRASKTLEIWTVPDILVLHLKRFSANSRLRDKIDVLVDFPTLGLDLEGRVGLPEGKSLIYDLFAVDNHYGGLGGGHYTAYAQNFFDKKWYEYNDQSVSQSSAEQSVTRAAYLLFYRRRSDNALGPSYLQDVVNQALAPDTDLADEQRDGDGSMSPQDRVVGRLTATESHRLPGDRNGFDGLAGTARSALNEAPPHYDGAGSFHDEGIDMDDPEDPDNPLPGLEETQAFIGPLPPSRFDQPGWSFDSLTKGTTAPPGSDNGMEDGDSDTLADNGSNEPGVGDSAQERMIEDFGDDGIATYGGIGHRNNSPEYETDEMGVIGHVQHVGLGDTEGDNESDVAEVRVSDEEGGA